MKKLIASITITLLLVTASAYANCGLQPIKPFTGCRGEMVAYCVCDNYGNCQWIWVCQ